MVFYCESKLILHEVRLLITTYRPSKIGFVTFSVRMWTLDFTKYPFSTLSFFVKVLHSFIIYQITWCQRNISDGQHVADIMTNSQNDVWTLAELGTFGVFGMHWIYMHGRCVSCKPYMTRRIPIFRGFYLVIFYLFPSFQNHRMVS